MEVFRIARETFSYKITSSGRANRWNLDDQFVAYASGSRSLCSLELIVHKNAIIPVHKYKIMVISIADEEDIYEKILQKDLPKNWNNINCYPLLQKLGSEWYNSKRSMILQVPSAIIPKECNYIINTGHPDFNDPQKISLVRNEDHFWDDRLL